MSEKNRFVLFDFDGVIADSFSMAFKVNKMICPHISESDYRKAFEGNINDWEKPVHTAECRLDIDFFEEYLPRMKDVQIFPGMQKVIWELSELYTLIVVSTTITSPIKDFMAQRGIDKHFTEIMGNDVNPSKVEKIKMVFSKYNTNSKHCVFVTDTLGDMREASKAEVPTIGVAWGFQGRDSLIKGDPFHIVESPSDLPITVKECFESTRF